jgi:hypothetical protein
MQARRAVAALRRPEYTGENRCFPCTVLNLALVVAGSVGLGAWLAFPVGVVAGILGGAMVYVRGYLIPGTPALTQRLLPDDVLAYFEHGGPTTGDAAPVDEHGTFDPEAVLLDSGALTPCPDRDDLCLDSLFRTEWRSEMAAAAADVDAAVQHLLPPSFDEPATVEYRGEAVVGRVDDATVAEWPSRAAFVADAAGAVVLADADAGWVDRGFTERTRLLAGLRLWLDRCSVCDGHVQLGEETVESCCRSVEVVAASCTGCGARIFEAPIPEE